MSSSILTDFYEASNSFKKIREILYTKKPSYNSKYHFKKVLNSISQ